MGSLLKKSSYWHQRSEYKKYKKAPELHSGLIGRQKPTGKQLADYRAREAAKPPSNEDMYYS